MTDKDSIGSLDPCQTANPVLWRLFCLGVMKRDPNAFAHHWTERDVFELLARRQEIYADIISASLKQESFDNDPL